MRFLPRQLQKWTGGELLLAVQNRRESDHFYRGISTDTRFLREGDSFLALRGERFDGHDFVPTALEKQAACLVLRRDSTVAQKCREALEADKPGPDLLLVEDTLKAYQDIASGFRQTLLASVIAITGSVGKTTTRRMVNTAIESQMVTHETVDNQNNLIGVPLTLLEADDDDDVIIAELGMDHKGEIARLSEICRPDIAILTSIGYSHAAFVGSREEIFKEKTEIIRGMRSNGLVLINGQDERLRSWARAQQGNISIWAIMNDASSRHVQDGLPEFWAENIRLNENGTDFTARSDLDPAIALPIHIPLPGKYLVRASLFALACAYALGLDMPKAAEACTRFHNTGNRQNIVSVGPWLVIDDSYNASPESVTAAIETLDLLARPGQRKVACLAGIRELGPYEEELHHNLGRLLAQHPVDQLFLVGEETRYIEDGLAEVGVQIPTEHFASSRELAPRLLEALAPEDVVLLKGSRYYAMETLRSAMEDALTRDHGKDC